MKKRLKSNDRWKQQWFHELQPLAKVALDYLEDHCDHAGIIPINIGLLNFQTGLRVTEAELMAMLPGLLIKFDLNNSPHFYLPRYFDDHFGQCKDTYAAKRSAAERLRQLGLRNEPIASEGGVSPHTPPSLRGDSIRLSCISIKEGGAEGETPTVPPTTTTAAISNDQWSPKVAIAEICSLYPEREGAHCNAEQLLNRFGEPELKEIRLAALHYRKDCEVKDVKPKYVLALANFLKDGRWKDWLQDRHPGKKLRPPRKVLTVKEAEQQAQERFERIQREQQARLTGKTVKDILGGISAVEAVARARAALKKAA